MDNKDEWNPRAFAWQVAERLIAYRAEQRITQAELAYRLGMAQSVIARIEVGRHSPSLATLAKLSRGCGLEFTILITPTDIDVIARPVQQP